MSKTSQRQRSALQQRQSAFNEGRRDRQSGLPPMYIRHPFLSSYMAGYHVPKPGVLTRLRNRFGWTKRIDF